MAKKKAAAKKKVAPKKAAKKAAPKKGTGKAAVKKTKILVVMGETRNDARRELAAHFKEHQTTGAERNAMRRAMVKNWKSA